MQNDLSYAWCEGAKFLIAHEQENAIQQRVFHTSIRSTEVLNFRENYDILI